MLTVHPQDTSPRGVPCPASGLVVEGPGPVSDTCPHCGRYVCVEMDPWGVWEIADHDSKRPTDLAVYAIAVELRSLMNPVLGCGTDPDEVDLAHARRVLAAIPAGVLGRIPARPSHLSSCEDRTYCRGECLPASEVF